MERVSPTKMEVTYNNKIIGKLLHNNILMVVPDFILDIDKKPIRHDVSPSNLIEDDLNLLGNPIFNDEFIEFILPTTMSLSIETFYDSNLKRSISIAVIRDNTPTSFPETN